MDYFRRIFFLEKRKYCKQQEFDHQQKSILVPSLACKHSSSSINSNSSLSSWQYIDHESHSIIIIKFVFLSSISPARSINNLRYD